MNGHSIVMNGGVDGSWEDLTEGHLVSTGLYSAIAILSNKLECIFSHGQFKTNTNQNWYILSNLFKDQSTSVEVELETKTKFFIFKRTQTSVCATSLGKQFNLVMVTFPLGFLICVSKAPTLMSSSLIAAENFCSKLS